MTARPIRYLADVHVLGLGVTIDLKLITQRQLDIFCRHYNLQSGTAFTDARQIPEEQRHLLFESTEAWHQFGSEMKVARRDG
jgi:hypothetical protein